MTRQTHAAAPPPTERAEQRTGANVFLLLAVLTIVEYGVAISLTSITLLAVLLVVAAAAKCWAIAMYFMHVSRVWRGEEAH